MKQIQSKKCKEDFNLLKSRVYNDYPLCKKLKKQTNKHYQKPTPKPKHRTKQPRLSKCLIFPGTKRPELSTLQRLSMDIPIKIHSVILEKKKARGGRWEEGKAGASVSFPFPLCSTRFLCQFILPSFPTTRRGLGGGESDMKIQRQTFRTFLVFLLVKVHVTENE